jgi:hypothetical protein
MAGGRGKPAAAGHHRFPGKLYRPLNFLNNLLFSGIECRPASATVALFERFYRSLLHCGRFRR